MTQATQRGQDTLDLLGLVANGSNLDSTARELLRRAQQTAQAANAYLLLVGEPRLEIGQPPAAFPPENTLSQLSQAQPGAGGMLLPVPVDNQTVGAVWLACQSIPDESRTEVAALVTALGAAVTFARLRERDKNSRRLMTAVLNSISDPLVVFDNRNHVLLMNPAAHTVFEVQDAVGKPLHEVITAEKLIALIETPGAILEEWSNNSDQTFLPRVEVVQDELGRAMGRILALRDVTRFKRLNRNQAEFVRIATHDLRSPLTSMQGFASMMGMVGELNEKQSHFVERILAGIQQMTGLVENIQDAGRYDPETGFYEMSRSQCDLVEMVNRIVESHIVPAEKGELTINARIDAGIPIIFADAHMLERAITNLVDNAIKYTPNGGRIDVSLQRADNHVVVRVQDTGLGISPDNQKHLFERHVRIARQEHKRIKGSGLGLFIVRSVARRHGGEAWVESVEGQGSTFAIRIPLTDSNLSTPAAN